jgi:hypothetical protein
MKGAILARFAAACFCLGVAVPLLAAQTPVTGAAINASPGKKNVTAAKPTQNCLSDLRAFDGQIEKDGYWLGGLGYGSGFPMGQYSGASAIGHQNERPSHEVRTLVASAVILARYGQQQQCEDVLTATRYIYKLHVAEMHNGRVPGADVSSWRQQDRYRALGRRSKHLIPNPVSFDDPLASDQLGGARIA